MSRKRVVVAGLGDVGIPAAIRLARHADVVGISAKPALVSGQELGVRLSRPRRLGPRLLDSVRPVPSAGRVRTVQAALTGVDLAARTVFGRGDDGATIAEEYDALVISTGVTNGFWRRPTLQSAAEIGADLRAAHDRLAAAESVIVVGGGAAAVSSAANMATTWPDKRIDLYFPGERALGGYHPRIWNRIQGRLTELGVGLHPGHRAALSNGFAGDEITSEPVHGAPASPRLPPTPCSGRSGGCSPTPTGCRRSCSTTSGFVRVTPELRVPGHEVSSRSATSRRPTRCAAPPAIAGMHWWPTTSAPNSRVDRCAPFGRRTADGVRCWASSPTGWRSSCPPARCSASRPGRSTGW